VAAQNLIQRIWGVFNPPTGQLLGVTISGEAPYIPISVPVLLNVQQLRAQNYFNTTVLPPPSVQTQGYTTINDGGGGFYNYTPTDTTSGAYYVGSVSGSVLTVTSVATGALAVGQFISRSDTGATIGTITSLGTGAGGVGTYNLSAPATVTSQFMMADNGTTVLVAADGSRWHLSISNNAALMPVTATLNNPATTVQGQFNNIGSATGASYVGIPPTTYNSGTTVQAQLNNIGSATGATNVGFTTPGTGAIATNAATALNGLVGTVRLMPVFGSTSTYAAFAPDGSSINISASTTSGIQECINYATTNGWNLYVGGGGTSHSADYGLLNCTTGISFPPLRSMRVNFEGVHIEFSAAVTGIGVSFDSMMEVNFSLTGEIVYQGNSAAVQFKPQTTIPVDTLTTIIDSNIMIGSIACTGGAPTACIQIDPSIANVIGNKWKFLELNASGGTGSPGVASIGLEILNPAAGTVWANNIVDIADIHHVISSGVQEGVSATNQTNLSSNIYRIGKITPKGLTTSGFNSFGSDSITQIGSITPISATIQYGVVLQAGSTGHQIQVGSISGFSGAAIIDQGKLNTVSHDGGVYVGAIRSFQSMLGNYLAISNAAGVTLTAAQLLGQAISHAGATTVSDTTDTAANIIAAIPGAFSGMFFQVKIMNFNSGVLTILGGSGVTPIGTNTIAAGGTRDFMVFISNVGSPAVSIFG
jgi:hypothetical protein